MTMVACGLVYLIARLRSASPEILVLAGITVLFFFQSVQSLMQFLASPEVLQQIVFWLFGSLLKATWTSVTVCALVFVACLPFIMRDAWALTTLRLGDANARSLGLSVDSIRQRTFFLVALLTAAAVSFVGTIGFVGLIARTPPARWWAKITAIHCHWLPSSVPSFWWAPRYSASSSRRPPSSRWASSPPWPACPCCSPSLPDGGAKDEQRLHFRLFGSVPCHLPSLPGGRAKDGQGLHFHIFGSARTCSWPPECGGTGMSLELKSVTVTRGKAQILKDISGTLERGQIVGLIGPNGTGKSTLVNAIATIYPFGGTIHWEGRPVKLGEIGYMPQQAHVRASISVTETVLLGRHEGLGWRVGNALVDQAIAMLDEFGIGHLHNRSMHTLSGGQQQLVLLAQRLLREPKLLLLDEATSALTCVTRCRCSTACAPTWTAPAPSSSLPFTT